MRLSKREVTDIDELANIIASSPVLHIGGKDEEGLFVVPVDFGFERPSTTADPWVFWVHGSSQGRKADTWKNFPEVAIELDTTTGVITGEYACAYSRAYASVMGTGYIYSVDNTDEKLYGLNLIMDHEAPGVAPTYSAEAVKRVAVWRIEVERLTGKKRLAKALYNSLVCLYTLVPDMVRGCFCITSSNRSAHISNH